MREIGADLWVVERPQRFLGLEIGTRMSIIRLADESLFLHSPVALDPELRAALAARGPVRAIVAPNRFHHLYVGEYTTSYPRATIYGAPGLAEKRRDLPLAVTLLDDAPPAWAGQIDQLVFRAMPLLNEVAFLHRRSRSLILTDLAFNVHRPSSLAGRLFLQLDGIYRQFGIGWAERLLVRDRGAARAAIDRILRWDFERIVVAHGEVLERDGKETLRAAFAWL